MMATKRRSENYTGKPAAAFSWIARLQSRSPSTGITGPCDVIINTWCIFTKTIASIRTAVVACC